MDRPETSSKGITLTPATFNEVADARRVADLVKTGDVKVVGSHLAYEYQLMTHPSQANLKRFLNLVQTDNASDLKADPSLPVLNIETGWSGDIKAYVTKPVASLLGNMLRSKQEAFADIVSGNPLDNTVGGAATAVAERGSHVFAHGAAVVEAHSGSHVVADGAAVVEAHSGSHVVADGAAVVEAHSGSNVASFGESSVHAISGATVDARGMSGVEAEAGARVTAREYSVVSAVSGSHVDATDNSSVIADGATVTAGGKARVWADDGSHVDAGGFSLVSAAPGAFVHLSGRATIAHRANGDYSGF
jgi:hypothetical protein